MVIELSKETDYEPPGIWLYPGDLIAFTEEEIDFRIRLWDRYEKPNSFRSPDQNEPCLVICRFHRYEKGVSDTYNVMCVLLLTKNGLGWWRSKYDVPRKDMVILKRGRAKG